MEILILGLIAIFILMLEIGPAILELIVIIIESLKKK